jgi:hypothetical protein
MVPTHRPLRQWHLWERNKSLGWIRAACQAEANRTWGVSDATATSPLKSTGGKRKSVFQSRDHKGTCTIDANGIALKVVDD